uniref:Apolipoprotein B n=1 Tax=Panagrolaimus sp. PS1159 TaxID=55785 RepID=A0AC35ERL6_9BILA
MINGIASEIQFQDVQYPKNNLSVYNYISNFDTITFKTYDDALAVNVNASQLITPWAAFQAILITFPLEIDTLKCPLAPRTFNFSTNPEFVIPIAPTFILRENRNSHILCNWIFTLAPTQQLKVVVRKMNLAKNINVSLTDETMATTM